MKRHILVAAAAAAMLGLVAGPAGAQPEDLPLTGRVVTEDTYVFPPGDTGCSDPDAWLIHSAGSGTFSHLGRVTYVQDLCSAWVVPFESGVTAGTTTLTAANGDQLVMTTSGTFEVEMGDMGPTGGLALLDWEIVDGTGRFFDASGSGTSVAASDITGPITSVTSGSYTGTITYDASNAASK